MSGLNKVCRACLTTKESFRFFLFESISADDYYFCTSVQAIDTEDLPKALCDPCYESLTSYLQFKQTCIDSQNTLVSCGKSNGPESELFDKDQSQDVKLEAVPESNEDTVSSSQEECYATKEGEVEVISTRRAKKIGCHKREHTCKAGKSKKLCLSCDQCSRKFQHQDSLDAHHLAHDGTQDIEDNHSHRLKQDHNRIKTLNCSKCSKSFATYSGLSRHRESAHLRVRLSIARCGVCGRVCASTHALREHARAHYTQRVKCVCHLCGKRVSTPVILKAHLETHNTDRERSHTCEHCGKKFYTNTILQSHILRLHTGRRYICNLCNYPFTDKHNLAKHIIKHEGKRPYKCDIPLCEKQYATNGALIEHKRSHSGERPFGCTFCSKRFVSKRRLTDHHRIHTGEKPHRCSVCEHRFTQRGTLQRHMKVHNKQVAIT